MRSSKASTHWKRRCIIASAVSSSPHYCLRPSTELHQWATALDTKQNMDKHERSLSAACFSFLPHLIFVFATARCLRTRMFAKHSRGISPYTEKPVYPVRVSPPPREPHSVPCRFYRCVVFAPTQTMTIAAFCLYLSSCSHPVPHAEPSLLL